jgi:pimeloyl-ACP methyl ester carboxylesterase
MTQPETLYAQSGDLYIGYQAIGSGPPLVYIEDFGHCIELMWEEPRLLRFLERLSSFSHLIMFDQRGTGVSDPRPEGGPGSLEESIDDIIAVATAVGVEQSVLLGVGSGGPVACLYAATHPGRVSALVLVNAFARLVRAPDHPWGIPQDALDLVVREGQLGWGKGGGAEIMAPSLAHDESFRVWLARWRRLGASPGRVGASLRMMYETDVRHVLGGITAPTLVIQRKGDRHVRLGHGANLAERIPGARYVELDGIDHFPWVGDADSILDEVEEFVTGTRPAREPDRVLATILFTDIVGSTERTVEVGDHRWRQLLDAHDIAVERQLDRYRGKKVHGVGLGDGVLAVFDGPARAIRCSSDIRAALRGIGLEIRAGLHAGEVEVRDQDVTGIAVNIARRVCDLAAGDELLVSSTVKDLVAGSGVAFAEHGEHTLKGVPGAWRLYRVAD